LKSSCGAAGIVRAGIHVVFSAAIAGKPAPTLTGGEYRFSGPAHPFKSKHTSGLARDPPKAAIKKRRKL
jgi:hypothetical protein